MKNEAFIHGFVNELEKEGIAPIAAIAARAIPALLRAGTKLIKPGKQLLGKAMSVGSKGGAVPNLTKTPRVATNLGGMADIIRARNPKQPANAGNTITTP